MVGKKFNINKFLPQYSDLYFVSLNCFLRHSFDARLGSA